MTTDTLEGKYEGFLDFTLAVAAMEGELKNRIGSRRPTQVVRRLFKRREIERFWRHSSVNDPWLQERMQEVATETELADPLFL